MTGRDVLILCYHAVSPSWGASLSITPPAFERQIGHLLSHGWQTTTVTEAVTGTARGKILAVTFDDGFASVERYALPILSRLGAPATMFAPSAFMSGGATLSWPGIDHWQQTEHAVELAATDWAGLARLSARGWEIGSHTRTHPRLTRLDDASVARELTESRTEFGDHLKVPCSSTAYPYGDVDARVIAAARAAGYVCAVRLSSNLKQRGDLCAPRVGIYNGDDWQRFLTKIARSVRILRASRLWARE